MQSQVLDLILDARGVLASVNDILNGSRSVEVKTGASGTKVYSVIPCPFKRNY